MLALQAFSTDFSLMWNREIEKALMWLQAPPKLCSPSWLEFCLGEPCDLRCIFISSAPSRLMQHIRYRHVESRPHECPLCHKTYKTTHTLVDHLETHREKCYTCSEPNCFYIATTARNFNHHMRSVHGGDLLLYCCHICNERFSLGRKLTKHLKDQHGFKLPPGHSRFR